jgi:hypothetical protein
MSVGYGNPPKANRFKKGQSGNRKGRRPKQAVQRVSAGYLFRKVASEEVAIDLDGDTVMMTRWEALTRQIHVMAYNSASAARLLHQIRERFPGNDLPADNSILVLSDNQMKY